ncbi:MAG: hypothetical protein V4726_11940 [Verrucomicrobiota bacterium]
MGDSIGHLLPWLILIAGLAALAAGDPASKSAAACAALSGLLLGLLDLSQPRIGRIPSRAAVDITLMTPALVLLVY